MSNTTTRRRVLAAMLVAAWGLAYGPVSADTTVQCDDCSNSDPPCEPPPPTNPPPTCISLIYYKESGGSGVGTAPLKISSKDGKGYTLKYTVAYWQGDTPDDVRTMDMNSEVVFNKGCSGVVGCSGGQGGNAGSIYSDTGCLDVRLYLGRGVQPAYGPRIAVAQPAFAAERAPVQQPYVQILAEQPAPELYTPAALELPAMWVSYCGLEQSGHWGQRRHWGHVWRLDKVVDGSKWEGIKWGSNVEPLIVIGSTVRE